MKPLAMPQVRIVASLIIQPLAWIRAIPPGPLGIKRLPPCPYNDRNKNHDDGCKDHGVLILGDGHLSAGGNSISATGAAPFK